MTFLVNEAMVDIGIGTAGLVALMGYLVVFFGLVLLMIVITALGKYFASKDTKLATKAASAAQAAAPVAPAAPAAEEKPAAPEEDPFDSIFKIFNTK